MIPSEQKRILLIEDDGAITKAVEETIKEKSNWIIEKAYSYISAVGKWEQAKKKEEEFDYIILDLNISVVGMPNELVNEYYPFIGMAFLTAIGITNEELRKQLVKKVFIYTGYEGPLKIRALEKGWKIDDMQFVSKRPDSLQVLVNKMML